MALRKSHICLIWFSNLNNASINLNMLVRFHYFIIFQYIFIPNQTSGVEVDDNCIQSYIKLQLQHSSQFIIYRLSDDKKRIIVDKIGPVGKWGKRLWIIRATLIKICNMNTWVLCCKNLRLFFLICYCFDRVYLWQFCVRASECWI